jgi:hypothetical protein
MNSICANIISLGSALYYYASCTKVLEPYACIEQVLISVILITRLRYQLIPSSSRITWNSFSLLMRNDDFTLLSCILKKGVNDFYGRMFYYRFWLNFNVLSCYLTCLAKRQVCSWTTIFSAKNLFSYPFYKKLTLSRFYCSPFESWHCEIWKDISNSDLAPKIIFMITLPSESWCMINQSSFWWEVDIWLITKLVALSTQRELCLLY